MNSSLLAISFSAITMFIVRCSSVEVSRIKIGKKQKIETLINEKALLLAQFLRHEKERWIPRVSTLTIVKNGRADYENAK